MSDSDIHNVYTKKEDNMIREHSKYFEFEHKGMFVEFTLEYNLEVEYDHFGGALTFATDLMYSAYTIDEVQCSDFFIEEKFGKAFLDELDKIASELVEDSNLSEGV